MDPAHRLRSVTMDGDYLRTPFWVPRVREAEKVVVSFFQGSRAGTADHPNPWLLQYGVPFQLDEARWAVHPPFVFARYRNAHALSAPLHLESAKAFTPCEPGATVTLRFEQPVARGVLLLSTDAPTSGAEVQAPDGAEVRVEGLANLWLLNLRSATVPLHELTLRAGPDPRPEGCWYRGAVLLVLPPEGGSVMESEGR
jgi:hypothetical protein